MGSCNVRAACHKGFWSISFIPPARSQAPMCLQLDLTTTLQLSRYTCLLLEVTNQSSLSSFLSSLSDTESDAENNLSKRILNSFCLKLLFQAKSKHIQEGSQCRHLRNYSPIECFNSPKRSSLNKTLRAPESEQNCFTHRYSRNYDDVHLTNRSHNKLIEPKECLERSHNCDPCQANIGWVLILLSKWMTFRCEKLFSRFSAE